MIENSFALASILFPILLLVWPILPQSRHTIVFMTQETITKMETIMTSWVPDIVEGTACNWPLAILPSP